MLMCSFFIIFYCYVPFLITEPELGQQDQRFQAFLSIPPAPFMIEMPYGFLLIYISSPFCHLKSL